MRLRSKLTLLFLLLAGCLLLLLSGLLYWRQSKDLGEKARTHRVLIADYVATLGLKRTDESCKELFTLGRLLLPREGIAMAQRSSLVKAFFQEARMLDVFRIFHPQGKMIEGVAREGSLLDAPNELSAALLERAALDTCVYLPILWQKKRPYLPLLTAVQRPDGKGRYAYLWGAVALDALQKSIDKVAGDILTAGEQIFLVDREKRYLLHAQKAKVGEVAQSSLFPEGAVLTQDILSVDGYHREPNGVRYLVALRSLPAYGWGVLVLQPYDAAYAAISALTRLTLIALGVALLAALLLGFFFGFRLSRPILAVAKAAGQVAEGDFAVRVPIQTRDEVGEMAVSFNRMAGDLQSYRQRVIEETRIRADLSRYLSAELVEGIVDGSIDLRLGGERRTITVMFADIVSFTPLSESLPPEKVVGILNEVFTIMTEIIFRHGGIVDKFIGDCVMAVFGAPYERKDDALRAVSAAEEMLQWLEAGNARWKRELGFALQMGIGINTGIALAGNIGSQKRMEYTVIGDTVNVAARLEMIARGGQILMTQETARAVEDAFEIESLGLFPIAGRKEDIEVFALAE